MIEIKNKGKARSLIPGMNGINKGINHKRQNSLQNNSKKNYWILFFLIWNDKLSFM